jgi:flotillin
MNVQGIDVWPLAVAAGLALGVGLVLTWIGRRLLYICAPNEILIFSGRRQVTPDGREVGFRVIAGGRGVRVPILETAVRMDVSLVSVPMAISGAYSQGGIPLTVHAIANIKVSTDPLVVTNAIERFLGRGREEIARVAKETLEGHLRGVLATMTPEEVNEDRLKFANRLTDEAGEDLRKLGLQLDTLKVQHVADDRNYLDSLGRGRVAEVVREAEVAESDALRAAEEGEAAMRARGEIAHSNARAVVDQKENELRRVKAELASRIAVEEQEAEAAAHAARAQAEKELQRVRAELATLRLQADVVIPAEADRRARELEAAGHAASIAEQGKATAEALAVLAGAWRRSNGRALDITVLQQLEPIVASVAGAANRIEIGGATLLDRGDGKALAACAAARPAAIAALFEEIARATGIDVLATVKGAV